MIFFKDPKMAETFGTGASAETVFARSNSAFAWVNASAETAELPVTSACRRRRVEIARGGELYDMRRRSGGRDERQR